MDITKCMKCNSYENGTFGYYTIKKSITLCRKCRMTLKLNYCFSCKTKSFFYSEDSIEPGNNGNHDIKCINCRTFYDTESGR